MTRDNRQHGRRPTNPTARPTASRPGGEQRSSSPDVRRRQRPALDSDPPVDPSIAQFQHGAQARRPPPRRSARMSRHEPRRRSRVGGRRHGTARREHPPANRPAVTHDHWLAERSIGPSEVHASQPMAHVRRPARRLHLDWATDRPAPVELSAGTSSPTGNERFQPYLFAAPARLRARPAPACAGRGGCGFLGPYEASFEGRPRQPSSSPPSRRSPASPRRRRPPAAPPARAGHRAGARAAGRPQPGLQRRLRARARAACPGTASCRSRRRGARSSTRASCAWR